MGFETSFKEATKTLLHGNLSNESLILGHLSDQLLRACHQLEESNDTDKDFHSVRSLSDVWSGVSVRAVLDACSSNGIACQYLADKLVSKIRGHQGSGNKELRFYARCLSFLMTKMKSKDQNGNDMNVVRQGIEDIQAIMGKFVDVSA
jgi:hypothetical protein